MKKAMISFFFFLAEILYAKGEFLTCLKYSRKESINQEFYIQKKLTLKYTGHSKLLPTCENSWKVSASSSWVNFWTSFRPNHMARQVSAWVVSTKYLPACRTKSKGREREGNDHELWQRKHNTTIKNAGDKYGGNSMYLCMKMEK
jgi:hypothetical protein